MYKFASCAASYLLSQLLNKNEGANEDVGICQVCLEALEVDIVTKLLQQVTNKLKAHGLVAGVDRLHCCCQGRLVLGLEHGVDHLDLHTAVDLGDDTAQLLVGGGEQTLLRTCT